MLIKDKNIDNGNGCLPRNMYQYGANWTGTDISEEQIGQAKRLSKNMEIDYYVFAVEHVQFPDNTFD